MIDRTGRSGAPDGDRAVRQLAAMTRRSLLARGVGVAGLLTVPALLAACGGDDDSDGSSGDASASSAAPASSASSAASSAAAATGSVGGNVDFLSWEGYDLPTVMEAWNKAHDVTFRATYISNNDNIPAKLKVGGGAFDLITYTHFYKESWSKLGLFKSLDPDRLPNLAGEGPFFKSSYKDYWLQADGTWTGVPWTWGSIGITWDDKAVPGGLTSYFDLLDPKFKGKVGIPDDPIGVWQTACVACGADPAKVTSEQNDKVTGFLRDLVKQTKTVSPTFGDLATLFGSRDVTVAFDGWAALNVFAAGAGNHDVKSSLPKEGGYTFADVYAIPSTADNDDTVYAWINEVLTPEINARAAENLVAGATVEKSIPLLNAETKALYPYDDLEAQFENAPLFGIPPQTSDEFVTYPKMLESWQSIKAGA